MLSDLVRGFEHLTVDSEGRATEVQLGPSGFLDQQGLVLAKGDAVEVTGSVVEHEQPGASLLIAREIRKGAEAVTLRDERGVPAWSGGPRR